MKMQAVIRFMLLGSIYLAFAGQTGADEWAAAALCAGFITLLSLLADRWQTMQFHFVPAVVLRQVLTALPRLVTDSARLVPRILRGGWQTGTMSQEFVDGPASPRDPAWWAVFTLTTSLPPNSYVIARLPAPNEIMIHRLVSR
jgi:hypothetical protein